MSIASRRRRTRVGRPPGPAPDPQQRRAELLEAAVRAIRRLGPNASMDEIAAEAGLTKPILYANFGKKAGLAGALADRYLTDLIPAVLGSFEGGRDPKEMVRSAIDTFIAFVEADPEVYRFLVRGVGGDERSFIEQRLITDFGLRLAQVLRAGLRAAGVDSGPAELWAFSILGTVISGAEWWQARPSMSRADLVDYLASFVWEGLSGGGVARLEAGPFGVVPEDTPGKNPRSNAE
jgi:AcrR family transcriptional regulator